MKFWNHAWRYSPSQFPAYRMFIVLNGEKAGMCYVPVRDVTPDINGNLPEGGFKVIRSRQNHTPIIIPGEDDSGAYAIFTIENGLKNGGIRFAESSNCEIVRHLHATNKGQSALAVFAIIQPEQTLSFTRWGNNANEIIHYSIDEYGLLNRERIVSNPDDKDLLTRWNEFQSVKV